MTDPVGAAYAALVAAGELKPDPAQARTVAALDRLAASMKANSNGLLSRFLGSRDDGPDGVYLWGGVGRGKSMLMDLAFDHIDVSPKRRVHFHAFMLETHQRLREARRSEEGDPIDEVADRIAAEARLLAFDEMIVNNPADAMILSRLFEKLLAAGVKIVTTSNRPPGDLYRDGLNRELFLPFIDLIGQRMEVVAVDGRKVVRERRIDCGEMRERSHENAICAKSEHGGRRLAFERCKYRQVLYIPAQQIDHAQRRLARTAVGLDEERQAFDLADVAQQGIQAGDIALANGAFGGVPVGDDRLAKRAGKLIENRLGPLHQHGWLGR